MSTGDQRIDYTTHILIGVRAGGVMTVISDWPYVPLQAEVQKEIDCVREPYVAFALCTPTSIMPADRTKALKPAPIGFGLPGRRG
jgi:hypothetical protein